MSLTALAVMSSHFEKQQKRGSSQLDLFVNFGRPYPPYPALVESRKSSFWEILLRYVLLKSLLQVIQYERNEQFQIKEVDIFRVRTCRQLP